MNILTNIVKEKGVSNIILNYKKHMEWGELLEKYNNDFYEICEKEDLPEGFIDYFKKDIIWSILSTKDLPYSILDKYQEKIVWSVYIANNKPSEDILRDFHDNFKGEFEDDNEEHHDWFMVSVICELSEDFLHRHREKIHWLAYIDNNEFVENLYDDFQDIIMHQENIHRERWPDFEDEEDHDDW